MPRQAEPANFAARAFYQAQLQPHGPALDMFRRQQAASPPMMMKAISPSPWSAAWYTTGFHMPRPYNHVITIFLVASFTPEAPTCRLLSYA